MAQGPPGGDLSIGLGARTDQAPHQGARFLRQGLGLSLSQRLPLLDLLS
jgi:hypothetical protein